MSRGGARKGAGRKAGGHNKSPTRIMLKIRLKADIFAALYSCVPAGKRSQFIERAVELYLINNPLFKQSAISRETKRGAIPEIDIREDIDNNPDLSLMR